MSPSPEFYLKNLLGHDREWEETVKKWSQAQFVHDKGLLLCHIYTKKESLALDAIIETDWRYLGCGKLVIPTSIVYRTERARWETPGLVKLASWNTELIGEGHLPYAFPLLGIDSAVQNGEIEIKNGAIYYTIEPYNQNVTEIHGIVFERDIRKLGESWSWRSASVGNNEEMKLSIISAMGLVQSLKSQFPGWNITPSFLSR